MQAETTSKIKPDVGGAHSPFATSTNPRPDANSPSSPPPTASKGKTTPKKAKAATDAPAGSNSPKRARTNSGAKRGAQAWSPEEERLALLYMLAKHPTSMSEKDADVLATTLDRGKWAIKSWWSKKIMEELREVKKLREANEADGQCRE